MSSIGIVVVLNILLLSVALSSDFGCPHGQYLNDSDVCIVCSSCRAPEDIIKRCHGRDDTVCSVAPHASILKPNKNKRPQLPSKNTISKEPDASEDENLAFYESVSSYNFMLHGPNNKSKKNNDAVKLKNIKNKSRKNDSRIDRGGFVEFSNTKFSFDKNGKHIKKDLSTADEIFRESNQSSFQYTVKLRPSNSSRNSLFKKSKSKQKKNKDDTPLEKDDEWTRHVFPHIENHRIVVDVKEGVKSPRKDPVLVLPSSKDSDELKQTLAVVLKAAEHLKNRSRLLDFDVEDGDDLKRTFDNVIDEEDTDEDDDDDDNTANEDDADDDDEDEDEDEDDADDDEDEDEDDDDESEDVKDRDEDEDFDSSFTKKIVPFGVDSNVLPIRGDNNADDDDSEAFISKDNKWSAVNEVNVEPFIDASNWQLLILVSAASACLLFFIVVNAYLCIYMKKWRHMKQDFEADVEDLSVRINLMQHAGFEADESSNMKNYITQLKGGKNMEKMSKSCARA